METPSQALDNHASHATLPWERLALQGDVVGYRRSFGASIFYSRDGYGWSSPPIAFDEVQHQVGRQIHSRRVFHGDIVRMAPFAGSQTHRSLVLLTDGSTDCIFDRHANTLYPLTAAWPPPSSPRIKSVEGRLGRLHPDYGWVQSAYAAMSPSPRDRWLTTLGLAAALSIGLVGAVSVQLALIGGAGPVVSSLGLLLGGLGYFLWVRRTNWHGLRRRTMLRLSLRVAGLNGLLWWLGSLLFSSGDAPGLPQLFAVPALAFGSLGALASLLATVIAADLVAWRTGGYADTLKGDAHFRDL